MKNSRRIIKVIYNPFAGKKRNLTSLGSQSTLEEIKLLFKKYQLDADFYTTKRKLHAKELSINAKREGYKIVVAAGGDGTISEIANGLVNSKLTLGIIPLGTFMNIPKMLSIPTELEKSVMIIKLSRTRKIDI